MMKLTLVCLLLVVAIESSLTMRSYERFKRHDLTRRGLYRRDDTSELMMIEAVIAQVTWEEAEKACGVEGGMLVKIPEEDEEFDIVNFLEDDQLDVEFWIGANDIENEDKFVWVDKSEVLWEPDELYPDYERRCVALGPDGSGGFDWVVRDCDEKKSFICQVPAGDPCCAPPEPGPCEGIIPAYYYDCEKDACEMFLWGGCDEEFNNFANEDECMFLCGEGDVAPSKCPSFPPPKKCKNECDDDDECKDGQICCENDCSTICAEPEFGGPCDDGSYPVNCTINPCEGAELLLPTKCPVTCTPNHCGGCRADFYFEDGTLVDYDNLCRFEPGQDDCAEDDMKERWYYDCETKQCESFKGCEGDGNNFKTKEECHLGCEIFEK